jgi:EAL domain-containing protein (putative c-di-GMP-specific phosphodiesterase class I)
MLSPSINPFLRPAPALATRLQRGRIRQVLEHHSFQTAFQPIFCLSSNRVAGVECLTRFQSRPYRSPDEWFRDAHDVGLGLELEIETLTAALKGLQIFPASVFLALNVSPHLVLEGRLGSHMAGSDLSRIVFEITEHTAIDDYDAVKEALRPMRQRGARLAIDDVGAGYASMQHILNLRPDLIKLDMSLTRNVHLCAGRSALVSGLAQFAEAVGATVIAEGVELQPQLQHLRNLGIKLAQGYLLAQPLVPSAETNRS